MPEIGIVGLVVILVVALPMIASAMRRANRNDLARLQTGHGVAHPFLTA